MATMPGAHREEQLLFVGKVRAIIAIKGNMPVKKKHMHIHLRREARSTCMSFRLFSLWKTCMRMIRERDGGLNERSFPTQTTSSFYFLPFLFSTSGVPAEVSNPALTSLQPTSAHISSLQYTTRRSPLCEPGLILLVEHYETLELSFCPLCYLPADPQTQLSSQALGENPRKAEWGKCQILALNSADLELCFAGVYTEQGCWAEPWAVNHLFAAWAEFLGTNVSF